MKIPFNELNRSFSEAGEEIENVVSRVIRSGVFFFGEETEAFKEELKKYIGTEFVIPVGNGTDALEIALHTVGVGKDDSVVTVANAGGYATTAIRKCGAYPVYVDVSLTTHQMDLDSLDKTIAELHQKPSALVLTHLYGFMAPAQQIVEFCRAHSIPVVEDCAQAIGIRENQFHAGRFGDIATLSFYPTKNLGGAGDSGAVFTEKSELAERASQLSQYGWGEKYHNVLEFGRNSRMDEIQASILRINLRKVDDKNSKRLEIISYLAENLENLTFPHYNNHPFNGHLTVVLEEARDEMRYFLLDREIQTAIHYPVPDHHQVAWHRPNVTLENTEALSQRILSLPIFPELTDLEVEYLCQALSEWKR